MALAQATFVLDHIDVGTGIPMVALRRMLGLGLAEPDRGEGIEIDDAALDKLRAEWRNRRQARP